MFFPLPEPFVGIWARQNGIGSVEKTLPHHAFRGDEVTSGL
jgi:hypothetical protein